MFAENLGRLAIALPWCALSAFGQAGSAAAPLVQMRWEQRLDDPAQPSIEWAADAALAPGGESLVVGTFGAPPVAALAKIGLAGELVWIRRFAFVPGSDNMALFVRRDGRGGLFVAGTSIRALNPTGRDLFLMKVSESTGLPVWNAPVCYDGRAHGDDVPRQLLVDAQGDALVALDLFDTSATPTADIGIVSFSGLTGDRRWEQRLQSLPGGGSAVGLQDAFGRMDLGADGTLVVAATRMPAQWGGGGPILGSPLAWIGDARQGALRPLPIAFPLPYLALLDVAVEAGARAFAVSGAAYTGIDVDLFVAKYRLDGTLEWWSSCGPTGLANEWVRGVDLATNGDVVIVGDTDGSGAQEWFTFLYHFTVPPPPGALVSPVWGSVFAAGPVPRGCDVPCGVRIDRLGNVAVAGVAWCPGNRHQMIDLRYDAQGALLAGAPAFQPRCSAAGESAVLSWNFDGETGESVMAGYLRDHEAGASALQCDWAVFRSGRY